jgi:hypothetical protein
MRRFLGWTLAGLMAFALAGCASTGAGATPCEKCDYGYVAVGQRARFERRAWCLVDGKKMDCTKTPPECPECAKATQK